MNAEIRRATPEDEEALVALFERFASEQAALDVRLEYASDAALRYRNSLQEALRSRDSVAFVAIEDGIVVGYQSAEHWYEAPLYAEGREVYLNELYVAPPYRGRGIGRALAEAVLGWARAEGAVRVRFNVLTGNEASERLWTTLGARPLSTIYTVELSAAPSPPVVRSLGFEMPERPKLGNL